MEQLLLPKLYKPLTELLTTPWHLWKSDKLPSHMEQPFRAGREGGNRAGRTGSQGHIYRPFVNVSHRGEFTVLSLASTQGINPANLLEAGEDGRILQDRDGIGHCVSRQRQLSAAPIPSPFLQLEEWD